MRLAIGGPTRDDVPASFARDLAHLFAYTREFGPWGKDVILGFIHHTYIHEGRNVFLEGALKQGATHVLWLDTDMTFPRTAAVQLHAHGRPIVGCNYPARRSGRPTAQRDDGSRIETTEASRGLEAIGALGFGVLLMETAIVAALNRPWFRFGLNAHGGNIGEDVMFCRAVRALGHTVYLDHDLSKSIGHVGQHEYRLLEEAEAEIVPA